MRQWFFTAAGPEPARLVPAQHIIRVLSASEEDADDDLDDYPRVGSRVRTDDHNTTGLRKTRKCDSSYSLFRDRASVRAS